MIQHHSSKPVSMPSPFRLLLFALALPLLTSSPAGAQRSHNGVQSAIADSTVATLFAGCYQLTMSPPPSRYQLRLRLLRVGRAWDAEAYGSGAHNRAGDSWSWSPVDTNAFNISWSGIDSAMESEITRRGSVLRASGTMFSGTPVRRTRLKVDIVRVECPSAA